MKKLILTSLAIVPLMVSAQLVFEDDFESYTPGDYIAENSGGLWTTWSDAPGTSEDAIASDDVANSGTVSAEFQATTSGGGPTDFVYDFGDLTSGHYEMTLSIQVADGSGGYFNMMHVAESEWAFGAYFLSDGTGYVTAGGVNYAFTHTVGEWNDVIVDINMDTDEAEFTMNGTSVAAWQWSMAENAVTGTNQLAWMDIFAVGVAPEIAHFYIDDVSFTNMGTIGVQEILRNEEVQVYPNPARDVISVLLNEQISGQAQVELIDVTGERVVVPTGISSHMVKLNVRDLADGVYFVRITDGGKQVVKKIVKN